MRIATWNVNSLKARLDKVVWWLERARPDVLLLQETKLTDADAPHGVLRAAGYELAHHGEGRWNGVAIAARGPLADVVANFGEPLRPPDHSGRGRRRAARRGADDRGDLRAAYGWSPSTLPTAARSGRPSMRPSWPGTTGCRSWVEQACDPGEPLVLGGDFNLAPTDLDVWDPAACHGGTHVSPPEREAFSRLCRWGLTDAYRIHHPEPGRYSWWDYRAGAFHRNLGMRIDHLLVTRPVAERTVWAEIDREARKGKPVPSDHAPVVIDLDRPGQTFDAGWARVERKTLDGLQATSWTDIGVRQKYGVYLRLLEAFPPTSSRRTPWPACGPRPSWWRTSAGRSCATFPRGWPRGRSPPRSRRRRRCHGAERHGALLAFALLGAGRRRRPADRRRRAGGDGRDAVGLELGGSPSTS